MTVSDADVPGVSDGPGQQRQELGDVRAARLGPVPDHHQPGRGPQRRDGESGTVHRTIFTLIHISILFQSHNQIRVLQASEGELRGGSYRGDSAVWKHHSTERSYCPSVRCWLSIHDIIFPIILTFVIIMHFDSRSLTNSVICFCLVFSSIISWEEVRNKQIVCSVTCLCCPI